MISVSTLLNYSRNSLIVCPCIFCFRAAIASQFPLVDIPFADPIVIELRHNTIKGRFRPLGISFMVNCSRRQLSTPNMTMTRSDIAKPLTSLCSFRANRESERACVNLRITSCTSHGEGAVEKLSIDKENNSPIVHPYCTWYQTNSQASQCNQLIAKANRSQGALIDSFG